MPILSVLTLYDITVKEQSIFSGSSASFGIKLVYKPTPSKPVVIASKRTAMVSPWYVKYVSLIMGKVVGVVGKILKIVGRPFQKGKEMIGSRWRRIREKSKSRAMRQNMRIKGMLKKKLTFFLKILKMTL